MHTITRTVHISPGPPADLSSYVLLSAVFLTFSFLLYHLSGSDHVRPDATVQAVCDNNVVGTATTDAAGAFAIILGRVSPAMVGAVLYPMLRNQCSVAVTTPLATCNASLGGGTLTAPLQFLQARRTIITDGYFGFLSNFPVVGGILGLVPGTFSSSA